MSCVEACLEGIARMPEMYGAVYEQYRRGLVRRFPYAVSYEYAAGRITVYGVFLTSRNPAKWRERVP